MISVATTVVYDGKPRIVLGDLNDIGGHKRSEASFALFRSMIYTAGLQEIKTHGVKFTWFGQRYQHMVRAKLDRALANPDWKELYPGAFVEILNWQGSDHRPLLLHTVKETKKGIKLFKYDNRWRENKELSLLMKNFWKDEGSQFPPDQFHTALKLCRHKLAGWKSSTKQNSQKRIQELKFLLHNAYNSSSLDFDYIYNLKKELIYHYKMEEEYWRARSRIQWLKAGDRNTRFFMRRRSKNALSIE